MIDYFITGEGWLFVGLILIGLEILVPGYIFLSFAIGSLFTYALIALGITPLISSNELLDSILLSSFMSLIALLVLKVLFNRNHSDDINKY